MTSNEPVGHPYDMTAKPVPASAESAHLSKSPQPSNSAKLPISLVVITKNEESNLLRCVASAPFVSGIVVLDSGSTDATVEVARTLGAEVYQEAWRGFGKQKARATELAKYDWILNLDADEALSPELAEEIQKRFVDLDPLTGYQVPRLSRHMGRWIKHGGWFPDFQLRLYHRQNAKWTESAVHERVIAPNRAKLQHPILHWVFDDVSDQVRTNNRYSGLQAQETYERGIQFSVFKLLLKPWSKFVETYFLKFGFLDGLPGFVISVSASYSVFLRWVKLWEHQKNLKKDGET